LPGGTHFLNLGRGHYEIATQQPMERRFEETSPSWHKEPEYEIDRTPIQRLPRHEPVQASFAGERYSLRARGGAVPKP
jgi:hypothetical protein